MTAGLFSTPIQKDLEECAATILRQPTTPAGNPISTDENLRYMSDRVGFDIQFTSVSLHSQDPSTSLQLGCTGVGYVAQINEIGSPWGVDLTISDVSVPVTWSVDDHESNTELWDAWRFPQLTYGVSPPNDAAFYAAIRHARTLTIRVASEPVFEETYDLATEGFWDTPVQPNLDACAQP